MLQKFFSYLIKNQVIFALFIIAFVWFLAQIKDLLLSLFFSYIIMAAVKPFVLYLEKKRFPKILAVLIPYFTIIIAIFLLILPLIPFVVSQIQSLIDHFPQYIKRSANIFGFAINPKEIENYLQGQVNDIGSGAFQFTTRFFGGVFTVVTIFIVSFYLLMYYNNFKKFIANLFTIRHHEKVHKTIDKINEKLGAWLQGQVILSVFIGVFSWIVLIILGIPFALPLALLAGILEVIPTLGPTLAAIPAVIVAFTQSPTQAVAVVAAYILIQMIEGHLLVPKVMQRAVGLNPVVVILSIMIGANLMGIAGALLAIPFVSFLIVIYQSIKEIK